MAWISRICGGSRSYPGARFDVLPWGEGEDPRAPATWAALEQAGVRVHRYAEIAGDAAAHPERYVLSAYDLHPNAAGHDLLAHAVLTLLREGAGEGARARCAAGRKGAARDPEGCEEETAD